MTVINDILDYARIGSGKLSLEDIEFDLETLISESISLLTAQALDKQLSLHVGLEPHVPRRVRGDPTRLKQILTNLLSNALKFTEQGYVRLEVSCVPMRRTARRTCASASATAASACAPRCSPRCSSRFPKAIPAPAAATAAAAWAWRSARNWWR
ncbi:Sensor histidine kinase RcsC [Stutzerimonas stutzeri]